MWLLDAHGNGVVAGGLGLAVFTEDGRLRKGRECYNLWPFKEYISDNACFEQNFEKRSSGGKSNYSPGVVISF